MLDIKFIREHPQKVEEAVKSKGFDVDINHVLEIDNKYREFSLSVQKLREERNQLAKEKNVEKGRELKVRLEKEENALRAVEVELNEWILKIPNLPFDDVPVGKDETENQVLRKCGEPKNFDFKVRDHVELGELLDIIDSEHAAKVSGTRFAYLKGDAVLLEFALIQYAFSVLTDKNVLAPIAAKVEKNYSAKPFIPIVPPVMIRPDIFQKMARLDPKDERYYLPKDDLYLIGSAEHTLGPLHIDETLFEKDLPIRYVGFSTSFRREAGSYGKDTRGILRVHQFDKLEMESFTLPEHSVKEQEFIVAIQEYLMQSLEIPYRVVMMCTGDMAAPDARQIDIEAWIPSQNRYRETHTADLMTDYQSRRLHSRVRRKNGASEFVHMNDATAFAIGRTIIAILENYQQEDGSIIVPKVLQKYLGKEKIVPKM